METSEKYPSQDSAAKETEQEKRARLLLHHIKTKIIDVNKSVSEKEEQRIKEGYAAKNPREKANKFYLMVMAYMLDRKAEREIKKESRSKDEEFASETIDPYLIGEIKVLASDEDVKKIIPETYGKARVDTKRFQLSEVGNLWREVCKEIDQKEEEYKRLGQKLNLGKVTSEGEKRTSESRMERLAESLTNWRTRKGNLETLQGFSKTVENTDAVANTQYEKLKNYKKELDEGFVWLPSRKEIHKETVESILNHRWPVLIGEAGTGKSDQADAAAIELTGYSPTHVACSSKTSEKDLIKDLALDPETDGSYEVYGPLMSAFTGYEDSRQTEPVFTGRIVRFDEAYRIPHDSSVYSIIKEACQLKNKAGKMFYGKPVLPGSSAILTTNPPGPRYENRYEPDTALRRELAEIHVNYPEMSNKDPELYEFALTALFNKDNHITVAKEELSPAYEKKDVLDNEQITLEDGSIVIARDEMIQDMTDVRHGALWRFCGAVKSLQNSFVYDNAQMERYPDTLLRFKEDADGDVEVTTGDSGLPLTLRTSTVTLGELASWLAGFDKRGRKKDKEWRTDTLTEWLNLKIKAYLKQADKNDKKKVEAIFKHFHFLEDRIPDLSQAKPLTPKEIGYLSPRVPRPVHLKKPGLTEEKIKKGTEAEPSGEVEEYETEQVLLEDGTRILIRKREFSIGKEEVRLNNEFISEDEESFCFAGVVEDEESEHNGKPVGQLVRKGRKKRLYRIFSPDEVGLGIEKKFGNDFEIEVAPREYDSRIEEIENSTEINEIEIDNEDS